MARFVIVATPRAATGYTARLLERLGISCGHERFFHLKGTLTDFLGQPDGTGDSSWMGVPFIDQLDTDVRIVHQTRHPLKVIQSLLDLRFLDLDAEGHSVRTGTRGKFTEFALRHCPELLEQRDDRARAIWFYYYWNKRIDERCTHHPILRYPVERLDVERLRSILTHLDLPESRWTDDDLAAALGDVPTDVNAKRELKQNAADQIDWPDLPPLVCQLAESYGYKSPQSETIVKSEPQPPIDVRTDPCDDVFETVRQQIYRAQLVWRSEREFHRENHLALEHELATMRTDLAAAHKRLSAAGLDNGSAPASSVNAQILGAARTALEETVQLLEGPKGKLNSSSVRLRARACLRRFAVDGLVTRPLELLPEVVQELLRLADQQMTALAEKVERRAEQECAAERDRRADVERKLSELEHRLAAMQGEHARVQAEQARAITEQQHKYEERIAALTAQHESELQSVQRTQTETLEKVYREREQAVARLRREHAEQMSTLKRQQRETTTKRQAMHDEALDKADREARELKRTLMASKSEADRLQNKLNRLMDQYQIVRAELDLREQEVRYKLGDALVSAYYHPTQLLRLPGRAARLFVEGRRRARERDDTPAAQSAVVTPESTVPSAPEAARAPATVESGSAPKTKSRDPAVTSNRSEGVAKAARTVTTPRVRFEPITRPVTVPRLPLLAGALMDEFTYECFRDECRLVTFTPQDFREVLSREKPTFLFVESTWRGNDATWRTMLNRPSYAADDPFPSLISWCRAQGIPTVFWNKEDPPNFDRFINAARLCDYIFTTDADCIPRYREYTDHDRIFALPFAAQCSIHNPINSKQPRRGNFCFAGTYYREKYPQRRRDLETLLKPARTRGLQIFDRQHEYTKSRLYKFPEAYEPFISGALPYLEMVSAYKAYEVFLNINSVRESPTMFSRRVLELLACGTAVISTPSVGVEELLGRDAVAMAETEQEAAEWMDRLMNEPELRERMIITGQRRVLSEHTYEHRLRTIIDKIGLDYPPVQRRVSVITVTNRPEHLENALANYARQSYPHKEFILVLNSDSFSMEEVQQRVVSIPNVRLLKVPQSKTLGHCLNRAIKSSSFEYIAKCDDDDFYGEHYLTDMINAFRYSGTEIVGKRSYFAYLEERDCLALRFAGSEHAYTPLVSGATIVARRDLFHDIPFPEDVERGVDTQFQKRCAERGVTMYATDRFNFVAHRRQAVDTHTWQISADEFLDRCQVVGYMKDYTGKVCV
jgi:spore maturation protein CgeB